MRTAAVVTLTACMLFGGSCGAYAQLFGGTLGGLVDQVPGAKQVNHTAGEAVKVADHTITQPLVKGVDHVAHETGKALDQTGVTFDKNATQPTLEGGAHILREAGKVVDQVGNDLDKKVTQPVILSPSRSLIGQAAQGLDHFGGEIDKSVFQPIGRGWTHFWGEWQLIGKAEAAARDVLADGDGRAKVRIDQAGSVVGNLEQKALNDVSGLVRNAMFWLFLALAGTGVSIVLVFRLTQKKLRTA